MSHNHHWWFVNAFRQEPDMELTCPGVVTMIIRVYALWNRSRPVLYLVLSMFFAHLGTYSSMMAYSLATAAITSNTPPFTGCMVMPTWDKAWITFTTSIALETLLFILIVAGSYPIVRQRGMKAPFYSLLFEDGLAYYSIVIISQVISFIALKVYTPVTATFLGSYPTVAIIGIACGRLLLRPQRLLLGYGAETSDSFRSDGLRTADDITLEFPNRKAESYMTRDLPGERLKAMDEDGDTFELGTPSGSNTISIPNRLSPNREIG